MIIYDNVIFYKTYISNVNSLHSIYKVNKTEKNDKKYDIHVINYHDIQALLLFLGTIKTHTFIIFLINTIIYIIRILQS